MLELVAKLLQKAFPLAAGIARIAAGCGLTAGSGLAGRRARSGFLAGGGAGGRLADRLAADGLAALILTAAEQPAALLGRLAAWCRLAAHGLAAVVAATQATQAIAKTGLGIAHK